MKVKICGITNIEDAVMCEDLGADALGFAHFPGRGRSLEPEAIRDICSSLGPLTPKVLVCNPSDAPEAIRLVDQAEADTVQLYSLEPAALDDIRKTGVAVIRAVRASRTEAERFLESTDALLFEQGTPGTGAAYDYSQIPIDICRRAIIAGGLNPDNLEQAKALRPYALDVSSGVEREFGRKDPQLVAEFIRRTKA